MNSLLMITTVPDTLKAFLIPFAQHFRAQNWRVDAMACKISTNAQCLQTFNRVWDVEWSRNLLDPRNLLLAAPLIQQTVNHREYDIVHVHTPVAAFVTRYALRNLKKQPRPQIIYTAHSFDFCGGRKPLQNTIFLGLEKLAGRWTDHLVVINREDEKAAERHKLVSPERLTYMPGIGVDHNYYSPDSITDMEVAYVRQELGLTSDTQLLLSVAEFIPRKHPQDILRAFARLARANVCLAFAGTGSLMQQMQRLASQLGVQNQVRFLGFRRDIPTLMRAAVATILVSEQEDLPKNVMESMCLGTPVIGTEIRGMKDLLSEGCGVLVKVGDIDAIAKGMAWVLDHPQEARVMGQLGRERMASYDLQHIIELHENLYTQVMSAQMPSLYQELTVSTL